MCGIAGFVGAPDPGLLGEMSDRVAHRGPDDEGRLERDFASISHRRLAVIDPEHGHQPMSNPDQTLHIVYNGEVHNFRELRKELEGEGLEFSTSCDTEVVLRAYEAWGTACFPRFNGMWALAILDERTPGAPRVVFSRDHLGVKPLYLAEAGGRLLFASEIKALFASPDFAPEVDEQRLSFYLLSGLHNHDEGTFFAGVRQLPPATVLVVTPSAGGRRQESERYWEPRLSSDGAADPASFRKALNRAVERRLIADVTVGTCLSGGLDSSTIVSLMSELLRSGLPDAASMGERLKTFSAVFDGDPIDEQRYIEPVLESTKADSYYIRPRSQDLFDELPVVVWHQDEPMVSSGPYAQYRVLAFAKDYARVLLDGQGGDELLAGYTPHQLVYVRDLLARHRYLEAAREAVRARDLLLPLVQQKLRDRAKAVRPASYCTPAVTAWASAARAADHRTNSDLKTRLLQDLTTYSLPPMLRYEDRNAMAHAIESRPPFLDQELVELLLALPASAIVRNGWSRYILREAMRGSLPETVRLRRKKVGFTTPEIRWLRAERPSVRGILHSPAFHARPYWNGQAIATAFEDCLGGRLEESLFFWRVLNTEAWLRVFHGRLPLSDHGARPSGSLEEAGDALVPSLLPRTSGPGAGPPSGGDEAAALLEAVRPEPHRHLFSCGRDGRSVYARLPLRPGGTDATDAAGDGNGAAGWLATAAGARRFLELVRLAGEGEARSAAGPGERLRSSDVLVLRRPAADPDAGAVAREVATAASGMGGARVGAAVVGAGPDYKVRGSSGLDAPADEAVAELEWLLADDPFGASSGGVEAVLVRRLGVIG